MPRIAILPSLLAADFGRLGEECRRAEAAGADALHLDVMDGRFVGNISFGPDVVRLARRSTRRPLSVHLMIERPDEYARVFAEAGADLLLIHVEAPCDVRATLRDIRGLGVRAGIVLNPETPAAFARPYIEERGIDEILCMSVHPGFGGQAFLEEVVPKIAELRRAGPELDLSVDGGIDARAAARCAAAGANAFIAGTTLFGAPDMAAAVAALRAAAAGAAPAGGGA
jgi:ribulose-phosphate 3-epimerase